MENSVLRACPYVICIANYVELNVCLFLCVFVSLPIGTQTAGPRGLEFGMRVRMDRGTVRS